MFEIETKKTDIPLIEQPSSQKLLETLKRACSQNKTLKSALRVEMKIPFLDPLAWLQAQSSRTQIYWKDRSSRFEVAGVGQAASYESMIPINEIHTDRNIRYYGGLRFADFSKPDSSWQSFGSSHFILPRFEIVRDHEESLLACNLFPADNLSHIMEEFRQLCFDPKPVIFQMPRLLQRWDNPNQNGWRQKVEKALEAFKPRHLEKIVLARKSTFEFERKLHSLQLFERLRAAAPQCFHFYFQFYPTAAFIGASPERLFRCEGEKVWSEALAGTRPRGDSPETDVQLGEKLLNSNKDRREHQFVVEGIRTSLQSLCQTLEIDSPPSLLKVAGGQHLLTAIRGTLLSNIPSSKILEVLHPTPAVGGYPRKQALEEIEKLESFDRGWYAGPIGWIGSREAEFAVAIRSGLVEGNQLSLFSGAGIISGSTPEGEWEEIEHKMSSFIKILTQP